jgi:hypothetical protein
MSKTVTIIIIGLLVVYITATVIYSQKKSKLPQYASKTDEMVKNDWKLPVISDICKQVRNSNPFRPEDYHHKLWKLYSRSALPALLVMIQKIRQIFRKYRAGSIAFLSRDMYITHRVFKELYPEIDSRYVLFSRRAGDKCSKEYKEYWKSHVDENTIVVDLYGTGNSFYRFQKNNGDLPFSAYIMCHKVFNKKYTKQHWKTINLSTHGPWFMESLHYSTHGSFADIVNGVPLGYKMEYRMEEIQGYMDLITFLCKMIREKKIKLDSCLNINTTDFFASVLHLGGEDLSVVAAIPHDEFHRGGIFPLQFH